MSSVTQADQFVSLVSGSEDYHIIATSDLIGEAEILSDPPTDIDVDIDGVTRDVLSWDIGADQFVAAATYGSVSPAFRKGPQPNYNRSRAQG